jgi:hypothetical protein
MTLLLFLFSSLQSAEAAEGESKMKVSTTFNNDFEIRYYVLDDRLPDPDDVPVFNYVEQVNRLNATAATGPWALETQVDEVALFANQYRLDDELRAERTLVSDDVFSPLPDFSYATVEKLRGRYEKPSVVFTVGDTYAAFGRGIALNLNRNVDIDIDTSIQGVKGLFRPGAWDVTVVAGQLNRQQVFQDNVNGEIYGDLRHAVGGARVERFGLGPANIGAHGVAYDFVEETGWKPGFEELGSSPDAVIGGATAEVLGVGGIDWYVETDVFGFTSDTLPASRANLENKPGYATYVSAAFYPGKTTWLVEGKRYFQAERVNSLLAPELYEVVVAPTLEYERQITEDSSATVNSNDIWGGRVRMDYTLKPGELVPYVSQALFRDLELGGLHFNESPETVAHTLVGVEYIRDEFSALINAGYRIDVRDNGGSRKDRGSLPGPDDSDRQLHGDAAIRFPVGSLLAGEAQVAAEVYQWGVNPFQQQDYVEIETGWTLQRGSAVALTWYTDLTTNPLVNSTGNLTDALYGAAELQVKPSPAWTLKAFYGAYKAGIRCSGGQCRLLPGFEGTRFSVVGSF